MSVKKTKKFKENRPENYHVHDNDLVQRDRELFPSLLGILPQFLNGREDDHGVFGSGVHIDHLTRHGLLEFPDPGLQAIILESMFSFLAKQRNRTHRPCSVL